MVNENHEIAEKIKDGSYYEDAREWYMRVYLYPISERSFLIIVASILLVVLILSLLNTSTISSSSNEKPFIVRAEDSVDHFSLIKPLSQTSKTTQGAVAKYFIIDYLQTREEYVPSEMHGKKLQYKIKKIKSSSSKKVQNEYNNYMNDLNPYSPVNRYQEHTTRKVKIKSFTFDDNDPKSGKARIIFSATTTKIDYNEDPSENKQKKNKENNNTSLWEATVHFGLPDIETIARTQSPLRFLVKYYKAKLVKNN